MLTVLWSRPPALQTADVLRVGERIWPKLHDNATHYMWQLLDVWMGGGGRRVWQVSKPLTLTLTLTLPQAKLNGKPVTFTDKRAARDATTYCYINATKIADIMIKFFEQTPDAASLAQDVAGQLTNVLAKYIKDIKSVFRYYRSVHTSCSRAGVGSSHNAHSERGVAHTPEQSRRGG